MKRLISWTGWTKEDYKEFLGDVVEFICVGSVFGSAFIIPGMF